MNTQWHTIDEDQLNAVVSNPELFAANTATSAAIAGLTAWLEETADASRCCGGCHGGGGGAV